MKNNKTLIHILAMLGDPISSDKISQIEKDTTIQNKSERIRVILSGYFQ